MFLIMGDPSKLIKFWHFTGSCAEYSASANKIYGSLHANCTNFSPPCPNVYNSTQAYKCKFSDI